jgi:transposase
MKKKFKQKTAKVHPGRHSALSVLNFKVAGIDVGASAHYVCVGSLSEESVRRFGTFTQDLEELADWLVSLGVESVAMESTGIYWVNLYDTLESRGLKVCLANARYVRNVPGRKSDVADSQWIQQLHSYGLLSGSFIAEGKISELRAYVRQRENLEKQKGIQSDRRCGSLDGQSLTIAKH